MDPRLTEIEGTNYDDIIVGGAADNIISGLDGDGNKIK
jgi:hypothetical protein